MHVTLVYVSGTFHVNVISPCIYKKKKERGWIIITNYFNNTLEE